VVNVRPLRFCLSSAPLTDGPSWATTARAVEAMGYDVLHLADHLVPGIVAPFAGAAWALAATGRLHVGTLVLNNDLRHPVVVAREAASLATLSGGRFELGLGAGHMRSEYVEAGIAFDDGATRVARLAESARVVRGLLAGDEVTFEGEHVVVKGHRLDPVPPPCPLLIGGNGHGVLTAAGQHADIVGLTGFLAGADGTAPQLTHITTEGLASRLDVVRAAAGARFAEIEVNLLVQLVIVTTDRRARATEVADEMGVDVDVVLDSPLLLIGTVAEMAEQLRERQQRLGLGSITVFGRRPGSDQTPETFAPVIEQLKP
jgi:probable F420-dependent oxidoreductase